MLFQICLNNLFFFSLGFLKFLFWWECKIHKINQNLHRFLRLGIGMEYPDYTRIAPPTSTRPAGEARTREQRGRVVWRCGCAHGHLLDAIQVLLLASKPAWWEQTHKTLHTFCIAPLFEVLKFLGFFVFVFFTWIWHPKGQIQSPNLWLSCGCDFLFFHLVSGSWKYGFGGGTGEFWRYNGSDIWSFTRWKKASGASRQAERKQQ